MKSLLLPYRVMATVVGVLLIVLILVGVPLANFDGSSMWGVFPSTPALVDPGSTANEVGEWMTLVLGAAHVWLFMLLHFFAFQLSRRAEWSPGFTLVTLLAGTVPILSFWAERRATPVLPEEAQRIYDRHREGHIPDRLWVDCVTASLIGACSDTISTGCFMTAFTG